MESNPNSGIDLSDYNRSRPENNSSAKIKIPKALGLPNNNDKKQKIYIAIIAVCLIIGAACGALYAKQQSYNNTREAIYPAE